MIVFEDIKYYRKYIYFLSLNVVLISIFVYLEVLMKGIYIQRFFKGKVDFPIVIFVFHVNK